MDIKKAEDKVDQADSFLTKLKALLRKHWGILVLILFCYGMYKFCVALGEEMDNPTPVTVEQPVHTDSISVEPYIVSTYPEVNEYGDTLFIELWSDGKETILEEPLGNE